MKPCQKKLLPWMVGIIVTTLLFALLFFTLGFQYIGSDDTPVLRSFMGYDGGQPASYHLLIHTFLARLLYGLALLAPGVAWFSILQLFLLWFSCVVLIKSFITCALRGQWPLWAGALVGVLGLAMVSLYALCRITCTTTSALVGAAAVAQLMSVDFRQGTSRQIIKGMLLSIFLLLCCYSIRQIGVLPHFAFWLLALGIALPPKFFPFMPWAAHVRLKPILIGLLVCSIGFGLFTGVREAENRALGLEDYLRWQNARIDLFDYTNFEKSGTSEILDEIGWSQAEYKLVSHWFFMDQNITTEAFEALYAEQMSLMDTSVPARLSHALFLIQDFFAQNPAYGLACLGLLLFALLGILLPLLRWGREGLWLSVLSLGGLLLGGALLFYLGYQGRLPMRAGLTVLFPLSAFLLCLLGYIGRAPQDAPRWASSAWLLALALFVLLSAGSLRETISYINRPTDPELEAMLETVAEDLDAFALENPDMLIIYDGSMIADYRLFPDTSEGIPPNVMFWGGYPARSPSWLYQLSTYGIDGLAMDSSVFLREDVLVAGTDGEPWVSLMSYVGENTPNGVDWEFYGEYGYLGFYKLYEN